MLNLLPSQSKKKKTGQTEISDWLSQASLLKCGCTRQIPFTQPEKNEKNLANRDIYLTG